MNVIYGLIPAVIILGLVMVGVLVWAVRSGQYEDPEGDANRILMDDDDPLLPGNDQVEAQQAGVQEKQPGRNWPDAN